MNHCRNRLFSIVFASSIAAPLNLSWAAPAFNDIDTGLDADGGVLVGASKTPPQKALAAVVQDICPSSLGHITDADLQDRCSELVQAVNSGDSNRVIQAQRGLQAVAPEESAVIGTSLLDAAGAHADNIGERISNIRGGPLSGAGLTQHQSQDYYWTGAAGDVQSPWGVFVSGLYTSADRDTTIRESGFEADDFGFTAGIDYSFSDALLLGAAFGYRDSDADIDVNANSNGGSLKTDSYSGFIYWSIFPSADWYIDAMVGYTKSDHEQDRRIAYSTVLLSALGPGTTTVNQSALSNTDSEEISFSVMAGYDVDLGQWVLSPYGRFDYADIEIDGYTERMSNPGAPGSGLALQINSQEFESLTTTLGASFTTEIGTTFAQLYPQVFAEYTHEFKNNNDPLIGRYVNETLQRRFALLRDQPDRNYFNVGASLTAMFTDTLSGFFRYQALVGYEDLSVHAFEIGIRSTF